MLRWAPPRWWALKLGLSQDGWPDWPTACDGLPLQSLLRRGAKGSRLGPSDASRGLGNAAGRPLTSAPSVRRALVPGAEIPLFSHCGAKEGSSAIRCGLCKVFACRPAGVGTARPHCKVADSARRGEQIVLKTARCRNSSKEGSAARPRFKRRGARRPLEAGWHRRAADWSQVLLKRSVKSCCHRRRRDIQAERPEQEELQVDEGPS